MTSSELQFYNLLCTSNFRSVKVIWEKLYNIFEDNLPLPMIISHEEEDDNAIILIWSYINVYIEIEINDNGSYEWFARNRVANHYSGSEEPMCGALEAKLLEYLLLALENHNREKK